ncbi:MAG: serine/threonine protein kinase [Planctomycetales bacterium]
MSNQSPNYEEMVRKSGLVPEPELQKILEQLRTETGASDVQAAALAKRLLEKELVTTWQNDKLVQGKHQGFFLGKYKLLRHLVSGGMSSVYLAEHIMMKRRVAVKILPPARIGDTSFLGRFQRECQVLAALDHPNIVRAHDFDVQGDSLYYMVLEYIDGLDLQRLTEHEGPLDYVRAAGYISQAADALEHAHEQNMVHRDMKPANLMLDPKGKVKVLDLGVARITNSDDESSLTLAHNEDVLGTADFLAPEQALNSHNVDKRADIYALGCTLYYLLTGHPPYLHKNLAKKLMAHQVEEPEPIRKDRPDLPDDLEIILKRMMAKQLDDRYQTMEETISGLDAFVAGKPIDEYGFPAPESEPPPGGSSILSPVPGGSSIQPSAQIGSSVHPARQDGAQIVPQQHESGIVPPQQQQQYQQQQYQQQQYQQQPQQQQQQQPQQQQQQQPQYQDPQYQNPQGGGAQAPPPPEQVSQQTYQPEPEPPRQQEPPAAQPSRAESSVGNTPKQPADKSKKKKRKKKKPVKQAAPSVLQNQNMGLIFGVVIVILLIVLIAVLMLGNYL